MISKDSMSLEEKSEATIEETISEEGLDQFQYGELETTIQTPSPDGTEVPEGFTGTPIDLTKSPFRINNDLFEGFVHIMMRDLPGNSYTFDGDKDVLWEIQIQVRYHYYASRLHFPFGLLHTHKRMLFASHIVI